MLGDPLEGLATLWKNDEDVMKKIVATNQYKGRETVLYENKLLKEIFALCFYKSKNESIAMWKIYMPDSQGVLLRFDSQKINDFFNNFAFITDGEVDYDGIFNIIHFKKTDKSSDFERFLKKDISFRHEDEYRFYFQLTDELRESLNDNFTTTLNSEGEIIGYKLKIDLPELLREIIISPFSPSWHRDMVEQLVKKYGLDIKVRVSDYQKYYNK